MQQDLAQKFSKRSSGILLHLSSLPNKFPIGNLGPSAYAFVDMLAEAKQTWWQMLPVNPIGAGNSPYSTVCSHAGEALFISPELLCEDGLLSKKDLKDATKKTDKKRVHYSRARKTIKPLLEKAFANFDLNNKDFLSFCKAQAWWLEDFSLFQALSIKYGTNCWAKWPVDIRLYKKDALDKARAEQKREIQYESFLQYCFFKQWKKLKTYANSKGVGLIGDIPIFVSYESSDVWSAQELFWCNKDGSQACVAGCPPDYFNKDGQRWGNALYRWNKHEDQDFDWWIKRFGRMAEMFDVTRIDHFIGFYRYWEIPADAKTAKTGTWRFTPGDKLFAATRKALGSLPFIAEDLGLLTPEVTALRVKYGLPAMKLLHIAFVRGAKDSDHLPCNYDTNCVVYTGTHDNDTTKGWYKEAKDHAKKKQGSFDYEAIKGYFLQDTKDIHWKLIAEAFRSVARLAVIPMQDVLGLGREARMNIPGTPKDNWEWRYNDEQLKSKDVQKLAELTKSTYR